MCLSLSKGRVQDPELAHERFQDATQVVNFFRGLCPHFYGMEAVHSRDDACEVEFELLDTVMLSFEIFMSSEILGFLDEFPKETY